MARHPPPQRRADRGEIVSEAVLQSIDNKLFCMFPADRRGSGGLKLQQESLALGKLEQWG